MSDHWHREKHFNGAPHPWGHIDSAGIIVREQCNLVLQDFATRQACDAPGAPPREAVKRPHESDPSGADKRPKPTHTVSEKTRKARDCTRAELEAIWKGKKEEWQLHWTRNNKQSNYATINHRACLLEALPVGYVDKPKLCTGPGHTIGKTTFKPEHGKCIVQACTNKSMHLTKDSPECMKEIHKVIALGKAAFIARGKD
jgi:hypothetical protein